MNEFNKNEHDLDQNKQDTGYTLSFYGILVQIIMSILAVALLLFFSDFDD